MDDAQDLALESERVARSAPNLVGVDAQVLRSDDPLERGGAGMSMFGITKPAS